MNKRIKAVVMNTMATAFPFLFINIMQITLCNLHNSKQIIIFANKFKAIVR